MKKFEALISLSRSATENSDFTDTTGIQTTEFVQYFTDAVKRIESVINGKHPRAFLKVKTISISALQEEVSIPVDCYMGTRVVLVEFNNNATGSGDFYKLQKGSIQEKYSGITGNPIFYIREGSILRLKPGSQSGGQIRITYQKSQPAADIRRGVISSVTSTSTAVSAITLDAASTSTPLDATTLNEQNYLTVVDRDGVIKMSRVPISSIDSSTGVVTLFGGAYTFESGESIAVGDFVCAGPYSSNFCLLPDMVERYLLSYVNWKIFRRDSNSDTVDENSELIALEKEIVDAFSEPDGDVDFVPVIDPTYVGVDDYGAWL